MEDNIFLFIPNLIGKASIASPHIELVGCSLAGQPYFFFGHRTQEKNGWLAD